VPAAICLFLISITTAAAGTIYNTSAPPLLLLLCLRKLLPNRAAATTHTPSAPVAATPAANTMGLHHLLQLLPLLRSNLCQPPHSSFLPCQAWPALHSPQKT
jgi:hypothetical protein